MKQRYRRVALRGTTCLLVALGLPALWASPGVAQMLSETQKDLSSSTIGIANTNQVNGNANGTLDRSNKGGNLRGLDRANHVAGQHGRDGRDNAAARHNLRLSSDVANTNQVNGGTSTGNIANTNQVNGGTSTGNIANTNQVGATAGNIANTNQVNGGTLTGNIANTNQVNGSTSGLVATGTTGAHAGHLTANR